MPHTQTSHTERQQTLTAAYKVKKKLLNCSSFFKLSLKSQNRALAQEVTLLKNNNRGLQVQNTALLKDVQAHKFELATSRGNERRMLDLLKGLKAHAAKATVLTLDLQAHVDVMIGRVSPDDDTPDTSDGFTSDDDIQTESEKHPVQFPSMPDLSTNDRHRPTNSTDTGDLGSKPSVVEEVQAGRRGELKSCSLRVTDRRRSQLFPQSAFSALHTSPVPNRCEESPSLASVIDPPSTLAVGNPSTSSTMLLNVEVEQTASDDTEAVTAATAVEKKTGSVKNKDKIRVGGKAVLLKAGKQNKTLTEPQGAGGDCEAEKSEATRPVMQTLHTSPVPNRCEESPSLASVIDPPSTLAVGNPSTSSTMLLNVEVEQTASDGTETVTAATAVEKKTGSVKNKDKTRVGGKAVLLKAGKENKTLTDPQGAGGDCEVEKLEATMQSKPISTLLQLCNYTEEVQPSGTQHHIASRIPKLRQRHAYDLNSEPKSSRAKESSEGDIPEDFLRFDTRQLQSDDDDNAQEHEMDHNDMHASLSLSLPLSEPSLSPPMTLTRKRVKKMTPADCSGPSSDNETAGKENVIGPLRVKKRKKNERILESMSEDMDPGPADLDLDSVFSTSAVPVVIPPEASTELTNTTTAIDHGVNVGHSKRNRPRCRETFVVLERVTPPTSINTATYDGGVRERPTAEVHVPSRRNDRLRYRETFVVPENNNESETYEDPVVPELTNTTTAIDHGVTVGHSKRNRPRCRETFVVLERGLPSQTSTNMATDDGGERERPAGEVHIPSRGNGRPRDRDTLNVPENNESSASGTLYEDPVVPFEASPGIILKDNFDFPKFFFDNPLTSLTNTTTDTDHGVTVGRSRRNRPRCRETFVVLESVSTPATCTNTATGDGGVRERPAAEVHVPSRRNVRPTSRQAFVVEDSSASDEQPAVISLDDSPATDNGGTVRLSRRNDRPTCGDSRETSAVPDESPAIETYEDPVPDDSSPGRVVTASEEDNMASEEATGALRPRRRCHAAVSYKEPSINCKQRRGDKWTDSQFLRSPTFKTKKKPKKSSRT